MTDPKLFKSRLGPGATKRVSEFLVAFTAKANIAGRELAKCAACKINEKTLLAQLNFDDFGGKPRRWLRRDAATLVRYACRQSNLPFVQTWQRLVYDRAAALSFINEAPYAEYWHVCHRRAKALDARLVAATRGCETVTFFGRVPLFGLLPVEMRRELVEGYCDHRGMASRAMREGLKRLERLRGDWLNTVTRRTRVRYYIPHRDFRRMCEGAAPFQYFTDEQMRAFVALLCLNVREGELEFGLIPSGAKNGDADYNWVLSQTFVMGVDRSFLLRHSHGKPYFLTLDPTRGEAARRQVNRRAGTILTLRERTLHPTSPAEAELAVRTLAADALSFRLRTPTREEVDERRSDGWLAKQLAANRQARCAATEKLS